MSSDAPITLTSADDVMDAISGATVAAAGVDVDKAGIHLWFKDGRVLVITGAITLSLMKIVDETLH